MSRHEFYHEFCCGGLSILLNKPKCKYESAYDIDPELIEFWQTVRDSSTKFLQDLKNIHYNEETFEFFKKQPSSPLRTFILLRMSRNGDRRCFSQGTRERGRKNESINAWENSIKRISRVAKRIEDVNFYSQDILKFDLLNVNGRDTQIYIDPTYHHSTRNQKSLKMYKYEMSHGDHVKLLRKIKKYKKRGYNVLISGYNCELYEKSLRDWTIHEKEVPNYPANFTSIGPKRKIECLWST